jgi:hypothetical protein
MQLKENGLLIKIKEKLLHLFNKVFLKNNKQLLLEKPSLNDDKNKILNIDDSQVERFYKMLDNLNSNRETQLLIDIVKAKKYTDEENI